MPFPGPVVSTPSAESVDTTTHDLIMPSGITAGQILLAFIGLNGAPTITPPSGWTLGAQSVSGTQAKLAVLWKRATGSETNTTYTTSAVESSSNRVVRVPGAHATSDPEFAAAVGAVSVSPDPPVLNPAGWAVEDTLWFASSANRNGNQTLTAIPAGYTAHHAAGGDSVSGVQGVTLGVCSRELNADSENPGTYTITGLTQRGRATFRAWNLASWTTVSTCSPARSTTL